MPDSLFRSGFINTYLMKIATHNNSSEQETLSRLLNNYRDTPHYATGVTPNDMLFRHSPQSVFPRRSPDEEAVANARARDRRLKLERQDHINSGKFMKASHFEVGDTVLIRNSTRSSKFQPYFDPSPLKVTAVLNNGRCLSLQRLCDDHIFQRHPDDVKLVPPIAITPRAVHTTTEQDIAHHLQQQSTKHVCDDDFDESYFPSELQQQHTPQQQPQQLQQQQTRQLRTNPRRNPRYFNENVVNH